MRRRRLVHRDRGGPEQGRPKYKKEPLVEVNHYQILVYFITYVLSLPESIIEILIKMLQLQQLQGRGEWKEHYA